MQVQAKQVWITLLCVPLVAVAVETRGQERLEAAHVTQQVAALSGIGGAPASVQQFLNRVASRLPSTPPSSYVFKSWEVEGRPTEEAVGLRPVAGADPSKLTSRIMDVDHYVKNIAHVTECRSIKDSRFVPPSQVRFYQRVNIPILGDVQHELVLVTGAKLNGYDLVYWYMLEPETKALNVAKGYRSAYNVGAWILSPGYVGYALSSAPMREDVNWATWQALTTGADMTASTVIGDNIKGMAAWASK